MKTAVFDQLAPSTTLEICGFHENHGFQPKTMVFGISPTHSLKIHSSHENCSFWPASPTHMPQKLWFSATKSIKQDHEVEAFD